MVVDRSDTSKPNPYERVEVFWPLEMCRNGVEVIDSPGLNEDPVRERITVGYLDRADAVVFVLDATQPFTNNEHAFLELFVRPLGHEDAFFVFNKINVVDEEERDQVEIYCRRKLEPFVKYDQRIFFVDAKGALAARLAGDQDRLDRSNLPPVERSLNHFLTTQRGRLKVLVPARELQLAIRQTRAGIDQQRELLGRDLDDLLERYARATNFRWRAWSTAWSGSPAGSPRRWPTRRGRSTGPLGSSSSRPPDRSRPLSRRPKRRSRSPSTHSGSGAAPASWSTRCSRGWPARCTSSSPPGGRRPTPPLLAAQLERTQREIADELREFATQLDRVRLDLSELASGTGAGRMRRPSR